MPARAIQKPRGRPKDATLADRRRDQIVSAATKLFAAEGYANADTQLLADQLGTGKGTIYRYFPSKEALFLAAVDRGMRDLRLHVDAAVEEIADPLVRVAGAIRAYLEYFDRHPEVVELLIQERAVFKDRKKPTYFVHRERNIGPWIELFEGLMKSDRVRRMPTDRITDVLSGVVYGTMFINFFVRGSKTFEAQAEQIVDLVYRGILSDSERGRSSAGRVPKGGEK